MIIDAPPSAPLPMTYPRAYDLLYAACEGNLLWESKPGRLVADIKQYEVGPHILDAGCGDGKNALFLEQTGYSVTGYDYSPLAINALHHRFKKVGYTAQGSYEVRDVREPLPSRPYNALVSYGLFHCLPLSERVAIHRNLQALVEVGGVLLFTCLTDELPIPPHHGTVDVVPAAKAEIDELLVGWESRYLEVGEINEHHLPLIGWHQHAAIWMVARKLSADL